MRYPVNQGIKSCAIRLGCEQGIYDFIVDYAHDMGMSMSASVRRLVLIGAHCESEHGHQPMPMSYEQLRRPSIELGWLDE